MAASLSKGDTASDFSLPDHTGTTRRLSDFLAEGPVVLYFYPAAMTGGCTIESCHFRDLASEFTALGAQRVGISRDGVDKQAQFEEKHNFGFPLLSDVDGEVAERFGVKRRLPLGPLSTKRKTFVIDSDATVLSVIHSEMNMNEHADKALEALRAKAR